MDTTKASVISVLLLLAITALQVCRVYSAELGMDFFNPADRNHVLLLNAVSCLLGIAILAVWWIRLFISREQDSLVGGVAVNDPTIFPAETVGFGRPGSKPQSRAPRIATAGGAGGLDIARVEITMSDGKTRRHMHMRVDCPQEARLAIGNSPNCGIHIKDSTLAPHHADLLIHSCNIRLYNPGYNNGVRVGNTMLPGGETTAVSRGQNITLGGVTLRID